MPEDDEILDEDEEDDRRRSLHWMLLALLAHGKTVLSTLTDELQTDFSPASFVNGFHEYLTDAHATAATYGRMLGGDLSPHSTTDRLFADTIMQEQETYLASFLTDLQAGRYSLPDGGFATPQIEARGALYVNRLLGTANEAWARTADEDNVMFDWNLEGGENCEDCIERAANSPYTLDALPGYPGDGSTECLTNCRCSLSTSTGQQGFVLDA